MSSVAKGFKCLVKFPVAARGKCDPGVVHGGVWKPVGDAEAPRLDDTRRLSSVDEGSIAMPLVTSKLEAIFGYRLLLGFAKFSLGPATPAKCANVAG